MPISQHIMDEYEKLYWIEWKYWIWRDAENLETIPMQIEFIRYNCELFLDLFNRYWSQFYEVLPDNPYSKEISSFWVGMFSAKQGSAAKDYPPDVFDKDGFDLGRQVWADYCELLQLIRDMENHRIGAMKVYHWGKPAADEKSDSVAEALKPLSGIWKGQRLMDPGDYEKLVREIKYILANNKLPPQIIPFKKSTANLSFRFYTHTLYLLWKSSNRAKDGSRDLWLSYIIAAFGNFRPEMSIEYLNTEFPKKPPTYAADRSKIEAQ